MESALLPSTIFSLIMAWNFVKAFGFFLIELFSNLPFLQSLDSMGSEGIVPSLYHSFHIYYELYWRNMHTAFLEGDWRVKIAVRIVGLEKRIIFHIRFISWILILPEILTLFQAASWFRAVGGSKMGSTSFGWAWTFSCSSSLSARSFARLCSSLSVNLCASLSRLRSIGSRNGCLQLSCLCDCMSHSWRQLVRCRENIHHCRDGCVIDWQGDLAISVGGKAEFGSGLSIFGAACMCSTISNSQSFTTGSALDVCGISSLAGDLLSVSGTVSVHLARWIRVSQPLVRRKWQICSRCQSSHGAIAQSAWTRILFFKTSFRLLEIFIYRLVCRRWEMSLWAQLSL
jgi:hypothetical protein